MVVNSLFCGGGYSMKHVWTGISILFFILVNWNPSFAFRCDGKIIDKKLNKSEILDFCGETHPDRRMGGGTDYRQLLRKGFH
ncbi:uncharacterized protein Dvar_22730 [Desulfosarcina variabilis str. Montpellier]